MRTITLVILALAALTSAASAAYNPPVIPVGTDAYRMWDALPYQQIGARAYMRSTYDRLGGNDFADASHYLYQVAEDFNVTLDVSGAGVLYFVRTNHWHGSPWHYEVDSGDFVVRESTTLDPTHPVAGSIFIPRELFPNPVCWTWADTKGADLMWSPIPFESSLRIAYGRTCYGTGYYIYKLYDTSARLSKPIKSWDHKTPPSAALALLRRAGTDIAPAAGSPGVHAIEGATALPAAESVTLTTLLGAPSMLRALRISVPESAAMDFERARIRVTWDGRPQPSIDCPIALFYGAGTLYNRDKREYLVKGLPINIRFAGGRVTLSCYYPMPFFRSAKIELVSAGKPISDVRWAVRTLPFKADPDDVGYFHATYRDTPSPVLGQDVVCLDTREVEGSRGWSGLFAGMSWIFSHNAYLGTLEGDPRFFFDDSQSSQGYGTGTEEWGGGGDYWGGQNMTLPLAGHPVGALNAAKAVCEEDKLESAYRFLIADAMPFGKNAVIRLEHGGTNESTEHYESVVYWYGHPGAWLVKTDELKIADLASEKSHAYRSQRASAPYSITSRYEWGVDTLKRDDKEIVCYPATTKTGRITRTGSEFVLKLAPDNYGAVLRRTLDYSFPNQKAAVYVADEHPGSRLPKWRLAGTWSLAGSNTCVFSFPRNELGRAQHIVQASNRRFRDDEFIIPRSLTRGRSAIRVRLRFIPVKRPLFPGGPSHDLAWSEIHYDCYCYVRPAGTRR